MNTDNGHRAGSVVRCDCYVYIFAWICGICEFYCELHSVRTVWRLVLNYSIPRDVGRCCHVSLHENNSGTLRSFFSYRDCGLLFDLVHLNNQPQVFVI